MKLKKIFFFFKLLCIEIYVDIILFLILVIGRKKYLVIFILIIWYVIINIWNLKKKIYFISYFIVEGVWKVYCKKVYVFDFL